MISNSNLKNTKLSKQDLAVVVEESTKLIKQRFEDIILAYDKKTAEQLFIDEQVDVHDWTSGH